MIAVPALIPETSPEFIVATALLEEDQLPPSTVDANAALSPMQIACVPDRVPATGGAVMVIGVVAVTLLHPAVPAKV